MKITVSVRQADIDAGIAGNCDGCPVALAVRRLFPGRQVRVGVTLITVGYHGLAMPPRAARFVRQFDAGRPRRPFSFGLDVPDDLRPEVPRG